MPAPMGALVALSRSAMAEHTPLLIKAAINRASTKLFGFQDVMPKTTLMPTSTIAAIAPTAVDTTTGASGSPIQLLTLLGLGILFLTIMLLLPLSLFITKLYLKARIPHTHTPSTATDDRNIVRKSLHFVCNVARAIITPFVWMGNLLFRFLAWLGQLACWSCPWIKDISTFFSVLGLALIFVIGAIGLLLSHHWLNMTWPIRSFVATCDGWIKAFKQRIEDRHQQNVNNAKMLEIARQFLPNIFRGSPDGFAGRVNSVYDVLDSLGTLNPEAALNKLKELKADQKALGLFEKNFPQSKDDPLPLTYHIPHLRALLDRLGTRHYEKALKRVNELLSVESAQGPECQRCKNNDEEDNEAQHTIQGLREACPDLFLGSLEDIKKRLAGYAGQEALKKSRSEKKELISKANGQIKFHRDQRERDRRQELANASWVSKIAHKYPQMFDRKTREEVFNMMDDLCRIYAEMKRAEADLYGGEKDDKPPPNDNHHDPKKDEHPQHGKDTGGSNTESGHKIPRTKKEEDDDLDKALQISSFIM